MNRIKAVLVEKEKTTIELAEGVGKTRPTVSRWCTNDIQPPLEKLVKVAGVLDVDVKDLLNSTKKYG